MVSLMEIFADYGLKTLKHWAIERQLPLLFERSLRLQHQVFEDQRALFSFPVEALSSNRMHEVLQICQAMSSPVSHRSAIERFLPQAAFVHFGFERAAETLIGKCYLELPPHAAAAAPAPTASTATSNSSPASKLTFIGYKWSMNNESTAVVSRYESIAVNSWEALTTPIISSVPDKWQQRLQQLLDEFQPAQHATGTTDRPLSDYRLLRVTEEGTARQSWDLNVYCCNVKRIRLVPQLAAFCESLQLQPQMFDSWDMQNLGSTIGHIAAGTSRTMQPFITIYHSSDLNSV